MSIAPLYKRVWTFLGLLSVNNAFARFKSQIIGTLILNSGKQLVSKLVL